MEKNLNLETLEEKTELTNEKLIVEHIEEKTNTETQLNIEHLTEKD